MVAYVIAIRDTTKDPVELEKYGETVMSTFEGYNVTPRSAYGRLKVLEGAPVEAIVLLEFPTFEEAEAWYESPAYQSVAKHRLRGAEFRFLIAQGLPR